MAKRKLPSNNVPICVLLPRPLREVLRAKARQADQTFSQLVRHAIRKEIGQSEEAIQ